MNNYQFRYRLWVKIFLVLTGALWFGALAIQAGDRYVATNGTDSGTCETWGTAASNIQYAVDAAANGETIWVSNGTYYLTNQISVAKSITVRSFSGSWSDTIVDGNWPAYTNRVFYLMNTGAVLSGLTITNGCVTGAIDSVRSGAGIYARCLLITNCLVTGNTTTSDTSRLWGVGICLGSGTVSHCIIKGNRTLGRHADEAGVPGILLDGNANSGSRIVTNCVIANNTCSLVSSRGAAYVFYNSTITWCNVYGSINCSGLDVAGTLGAAEYCIITNNSSYGALFKDQGVLRNCLIARNGSMGVYFSSTAGGIMENCTVVSNASYGIQSTAHSSANPFKIVNSIIYDNRGNPSVAQWSTTNIPFTNCCTYPLPDYAFNCITASPSFVNKDANNWRLKTDSPCVNAGTNQNWMTNSVDLGGTRRIRYGTVDIGAYERVNEGTIYCVH